MHETCKKVIFWEKIFWEIFFRQYAWNVEKIDFFLFRKSSSEKQCVDKIQKIFRRVLIFLLNSLFYNNIYIYILAKNFFLKIFSHVSYLISPFWYS